MRIPLQYQRTEFDCGPTALLNAISFLFSRDEIPPDLLRYVMIYTLDSFNEQGEDCKSGTSQMAMMFMSNWLNQYARAKKLPINCEFLSGEQVQISENCQIIGALQQGGTVVIRVHYDCGHYITLTGLKGNQIEFFDPYYRKRAFKEKAIKIIENKPCGANRRAGYEVFNHGGKYPYALEENTLREAIILFNTNTRKTSESTIEYFL